MAERGARASAAISRSVSDIIEDWAEKGRAVERAVLAGLLMGGVELDATGLESADFSDNQNRRVFDCIEMVLKCGMDIDLTSVSTELVISETDNSPKVSDVWLVELAQEHTSSANVNQHVDWLVNRRAVSRLLSTCLEIFSSARRVGTKVEVLTESLSTAVSTVHGSVLPIQGDGLKETMTAICERAASKGRLCGLSTGFDLIDDYTDGFEPGDMIILAARPSMGKTSLALDIAKNVARSHGPVLFISLEMDQRAIYRRLLSSEGMVPSTAIKRSWTLSEQQTRRLHEAAEKLRTMPLRIVDSCPSVLPSVLRTIRQAIDRDTPKLIVVDYIQLVQSTRSVESQQQWVAHVSGTLKSLARETKVPILCLCQLNRAVDTRSASEFRPRLSDLRDSGALEQDADIVLFIYRPEAYKATLRRKTIKIGGKEHPLEGLAEIIVAKNRNGETGAGWLTWLPNFVCFRPFTAEDAVPARRDAELQENAGF